MKGRRKRGVRKADPKKAFVESKPRLREAVQRYFFG